MLRIKKISIAAILVVLTGIAAVVSAQEITRNNEGRYFYTSITTVSYTHLTLPTKA